MKRTLIDFQGGMYEYTLKEYIYSPIKGFGRGTIQIYNNEKGMKSMTTKDVEKMRLKLNIICDGLIEFIKEGGDYEYPYRKPQKDKRIRKQQPERDEQIRKEYKRREITLKMLSEKYKVSGERIRQILNYK